MITEDYVSFETAKLLKEKGFDLCTYAYYEDEDNPNINMYASKAINWNKTEFISKPTLQMAMKWLREIHNFHIGIIVTYQSIPRKYEVHIMHLEEINDIILCPTKDFDTCEEACEAAIKYCLKDLI